MAKLFDFIYNVAVLVRTPHSFKFKFIIFYYYVVLHIAGIFHITSYSFFGFTLQAHSYDELLYLFGEIFVKNEYYFKTNKKTPRIIDCGSNIGMSILYFKWLYPDATIWAYEADPRTYKLLAMNCKKNDLKQVKIFNKAVSTQNKKIIFYSTKSAGSLVASIYNSIVSEQIETEAIDLATVIQDTVVDFIKIDIEGGEQEILEHLAHRNVLKNIQDMVIEFHLHLTKDHRDIGRYLHLLHTKGFSYQIEARCVPLYKQYVFEAILVYAYRSNT